MTNSKNTSSFFRALSIRRACEIAIVLVVMFILTYCIRQHTYDEPLEADEAIYALIAQDWIDGGKPYVTLWDNKPIGTFLLYRIAIHIFGYNEIAPRILATLSVFISTILIAWIVSEYVKTLALRFLALIVWVFTSSSASCYANGANVEIFMMPLLLAAYICLTRYAATKREAYFGLTYSLLTMAVLIKPVAIAYFWVPLVVLPMRNWYQRLNVGFRCLAIAVNVIVIHIVVYFLFGYAPNFLVDQLINNSQHVSSGGNVPFRLVQSTLSLPLNIAVRPLAPIIFFTIAGAVWIAWTNRYVRNDRLLASFIFASVLAVVLPVDDFPHYYILLLPFLIIGFMRSSILLPAKLLPVFLSLGVVYLAFVTATTYLSLLPVEISYKKYGSNWFVRDRFIGLKLYEKGLTDTTIFVDGTHPGIYFYSQNRPANRFFVAWNYHSDNALKNTTTDSILFDMKSNPPSACVLLNPIVNPLKSWLNQYYDFRESIAGARLYIRK